MPLNIHPPTYPFGGVVVNGSVVTDVHLDPMDYLLCLVMAFGNWEGGELVFYDIGIVSSAANGHIHLFTSPTQNHFNLHLEGGNRGSIVVRTDKHFADWIKDRNGHDLP
jgi:hypothetical protein